MIGVVWYNSRVNGLKKIQAIQQEYERMKIKVDIRITTSRVALYCENGDIWRMYPASDSARGIACNVSFIERGIDEEIIQSIIKPCTKAMPFRAFNYYGE